MKKARKLASHFRVHIFFNSYQEQQFPPYSKTEQSTLAPKPVRVRWTRAETTRAQKLANETSGRRKDQETEKIGKIPEKKVDRFQRSVSSTIQAKEKEPCGKDKINCIYCQEVHDF